MRKSEKRLANSLQLLTPLSSYFLGSMETETHTGSWKTLWSQESPRSTNEAQHR